MAIDFDSLDTKNVEVEVVTIDSTTKVELPEGATVKELKELAGLGSNVKMIDENNKVLTDRDTITGNVQIFASPAKQLG